MGGAYDREGLPPKVAPRDDDLGPLGVWLTWPMDGRTFDDEAALTDAERVRHDRLRDAGRRRLFALSRTAVRAIIAAAQDVPVEEAGWECPPSKPPKADEFEISISHCGDVTAVFVSPAGHPVGIDVEAIRDVPDSVARQVMSEHQMRELETMTPEERAESVIGEWACNEARFKAEQRTAELIDEGVLRTADNSTVVAVDVDVPRRGAMTVAFVHRPTPHSFDPTSRLAQVGLEGVLVF